MDPFKYLAKKHINALYKKHGENVIMSLPAIGSMVAQKLIQDARFHNLLIDMVKEVIRKDDDYMITKGKAGGVRKMPKSRKKKIKLISCVGNGSLKEV